MLIQWIRAKATSSNFNIPFSSYNLPLSFSSRTSYVVVTAEGVGDCETRTSKDDDSGYDYNVGIDQKYANRIVLTNVNERMLFLVMIGY